MFFPYGDTPNPRGFRPWMTRALILANLAVYFLISSPLAGLQAGSADPGWQAYLDFLGTYLGGLTPEVISGITKYDLYTFAHGFQPGAPSIQDLFFSIFLHGGLLHLLGNMLFLWIYGDNVEHKLGRLGFLAAYLVTGAAATLSYSVLAGDSMTPLVGASGAISGILGLYFILFPKNRVKIFVFLFPLLVTVWHVPARIVLAIYLLADNLLPLVLGADSGVAHGAHIGGFVAGVVLAVSGRVLSLGAGRLKKVFGPRQVVRKVPRSPRPDPRTVIIDAEYVDEDRN